MALCTTCHNMDLCTSLFGCPGSIGAGSKKVANTSVSCGGKGYLRK